MTFAISPTGTSGRVDPHHAQQSRATCDRVMVHLENFGANTVDAASVYVAISSARKDAAVYTDSRASLTDALGLRDGAPVGAVDDATGLGHAQATNALTL